MVLLLLMMVVVTCDLVVDDGADGVGDGYVVFVNGGGGDIDVVLFWWCNWC